LGYINLESAVINSRYTRLPILQINWITIAIALIIITPVIFERIHLGKILIPGYILIISLLVLLLIFGERWGGSRR
jgi:cell division protein FtsW (lipid II flippase)